MISGLTKGVIRMGGAQVIAADTVMIVARWCVAQAFFLSGLTKIQSFDSTVALFEYEYAVPLFSPMLAAWLATVAELLLPPLLLLGIGTRAVAVMLLVFNAVAMSSYPDISPAGTIQHQLWAVLLIGLAVFGAGRLSGDRLWHHRHQLKAHCVESATGV